MSKYTLSLDELQFNTEQQKLLHDDPLKQVVELIGQALNSVLAPLGVDVTKSGLEMQAQQNDLGIVIFEADAVAGAVHLNGIYVFQNADPVAWIGDARRDHLGKVWVDVQDFQADRLQELGGLVLPS